MTVKELQKQLHEAYAIDNLNKIALTLINLHKNEQFSILRKIAEIISDEIEIEIKEDGKGFNKFMMLYHPDRASFHLNKIDKLVAEDNFNALVSYSHILKLAKIEEIANSLDSYEDIDYQPVYEWDFNIDGFSTVTNPNKVKVNKPVSKNCNFYDAIKIREYGHTDIEYPSYYLEDFEEFELSSCYINDLDGVQFCIHAKIIDVSNNEIFDLSYLIGLNNLEELNLSDNQIGYIDTLGHLKKLRSIDLSNNYVDDLSPLFGLVNLEYVNISGNKVKKEQIDELIDSGVTVDY